MTGNLLFFANAEATTAGTTAAAADASAVLPAAQTADKAEARLIERIRGGDGEAFGELYKLFAPLVHGIVLARVPRDEVDDIAQNVFLSAYKNLHTLRDCNAVGPWLAMIARNYSNEFYRREKPTEELSEDMAERTGAAAQRQTEAREVLSAIRSLPEAYRETLILRLVEGLTGPEIAAQTGLTHESVRVNLHRGMKLLRQKLGIGEQ